MCNIDLIKAVGHFYFSCRGTERGLKVKIVHKLRHLWLLLLLHLGTLIAKDNMYRTNTFTLSEELLEILWWAGSRSQLDLRRYGVQWAAHGVRGQCAFGLKNSQVHACFAGFQKPHATLKWGNMQIETLDMKSRPSTLSRGRYDGMNSLDPQVSPGSVFKRGSSEAGVLRNTCEYVVADYPPSYFIRLSAL